MIDHPFWKKRLLLRKVTEAYKAKVTFLLPFVAILVKIALTLPFFRVTISVAIQLTDCSGVNHGEYSGRADRLGTKSLGVRRFLFLGAV